MKKSIEEKNKIEKEFKEKMNLQKDKEEYIKSLDNIIKSKKEELKLIEKEINERTTIKDYISDKESLKKKYEEIILQLKNDLTNIENDITNKQKIFEDFNAQLNKAINIKIINKKYEEEKNKNIRLQQQNEELIQKLKIYKARRQNPSDAEENMIIQNVEEIKIDEEKNIYELERKNQKNEKEIDGLNNKLEKQSVKLTKLLTKIEKKEKDKEITIIKYEEEKNNLLKEIQKLVNKNSELDNNLKKKEEDYDKIKNELNELQKVISGNESFKDEQKINIMKNILEEKYINKLNEVKNRIFKTLLQKIEKKFTNFQASYDEQYKIKLQELITKEKNLIVNSKLENLSHPPGIRTALENRNISFNNNNDNNLNEQIYSYECLNLDKLRVNIKEQTDETEIKMVLKNNGTVPWHGDTKLKMVEPSDIKIGDIFLNPQNPEEMGTYTIIFKHLKNLEIKEYKSYLEFYSGGKKYGNKITIIINILSKTEYFLKENQ